MGLFKKKQKDQDKINLPWIAETHNKWGVDILDLRPISQTMLSTSKDPRMAENAISYNGEDGTSFFGCTPKSERIVITDITLPTDKILYPGVLFTPNTMEHKWAIYFDGSIIYFIRSWLREIFVIAHTTQETNKLIVKSIRGTFAEEDAEMTKSILIFLLISHVLNEIVPAPLPVDLKSIEYSAGLWSFSTYGNMAHFGVFDNTFRPVPQQPLRSHTLLHIAVARGNLSEIETRISQGIDINCLAIDGLAPLHWAIASASLVRLLQLGADPDVRSIEGATPLMNAVQSDRIDHARILLDSGASVNATDYRGFTALHRAAEMGHIEITAFLLGKGADREIVAENHTALSLAKMRNNQAIIDLLNR